VIEKGLAKDPSARTKRRSNPPRCTIGTAAEEDRESRQARVGRHETEALRETIRSVAISFDVGEHCARPDDAAQSGASASKEGTGARVARHQDVPSGGCVPWIVCSILHLISAAVLVAVLTGILTT
jgi:hypothetical protein